MLHMLRLFYKVIFLIKSASVLENGLARSPPMGWMSWGYYMCSTDCENSPETCLNEQLILSVTDSFYMEGYLEAGYQYIIIDDCWSERHRDSSGSLVADRKRFPRGMKFLADYIHARGLKFGMYMNIADVTCMGYPGSRGFFRRDAEQFARWNVDYIKVDGCFVEEDYLNTAYIELGQYLNQTGRPMVFSCSWPYYIEYIHNNKANYSAIAPHCNLWRNYHDVKTSWASVANIIRHYEKEHHNIAPHHGPGHWNDPDMLVFGTDSLTESQSRIQLAVYTMLSAPLLLSCDMTRVSKFERRLLQNMDLIAVAQDPLGAMGQPYKLSNKLTLWVKRHLPMKGDAYHSLSFALVNWDTASSSAVSFQPARYGLNSMDPYTVLDLFSGIFIRNITLEDTIEVTVPPVDVVMYTAYPL